MLNYTLLDDGMGDDEEVTEGEEMGEGGKKEDESEDGDSEESEENM